jgi:hypothetical protein
MSTNESLPYFDGNNNMKIPTGTRLKAVMSLDPKGYNDSFVFQNAYAKKLLRKVKTVTAHRVYQELLYLLSVEPTNRNGSTVYSTQANLAKEVGCVQPEVCKAIKELTEVGVIVEHKRGLITINPKCAWNGKRSVWQEACMKLEVQNDQIV